VRQEDGGITAVFLPPCDFSPATTRANVKLATLSGFRVAYNEGARLRGLAASREEE